LFYMEHIAEMEEFKICVCAIMHSYWFWQDVFSCRNLKSLQPWKSKANNLQINFNLLLYQFYHFLY